MSSEFNFLPRTTYKGDKIGGSNNQDYWNKIFDIDLVVGNYKQGRN